MPNKKQEGRAIAPHADEEMRWMTIRLPVSLYQAIERAAQSDRRSVSWMARLLIEDALGRQPHAHRAEENDRG